jgi:hypothetical protein
MSYLGSSAAPLPVAFSGPQSEGFDGGTATFTLSRSVAKVTDIEVVINNVAQSPYDGSYSVSDKTLTTSETVSAGTKNVIVKYRDIALGSLIPGAGTVGKSQNDVANLDGTGAAVLPGGTTAQRPASPTNGMVRYNSTTGQSEIYQNGVWGAFAVGIYTVDYLVVGGGGSGGTNGTGAGGPGGGGAGGYFASSSPLIVSAGQTFSLVVGAGGAGKAGTGTGQVGNSGNNSSGFGLTAIGGGFGSGAGQGAGGNGGSGGGGNNTGSGGSGTSGQGNSGGAGDGGGGGGIGSVGLAGASGGTGGNAAVWLDGIARAGGGGGGGWQGSGYGLVGTPSGGATIGYSNAGLSGATANATANTGSGSGASSGGAGILTGNGGSGVVVIRYFGAPKASGGTITQTGGYTYHTFTSSGTFTA